MKFQDPKNGRWCLGSRTICFPRRPFIMGIVNINDDSFSGDGSLEQDALFSQCLAKLKAGADGLDLGAESARTNRAPISPEEECRRLFLLLSRWDEIVAQGQPRDDQQVWPPLLSINTWRTEVISTLLQSEFATQIELINDMSALPTPDNARLVAGSQSSLLIMHSVGEPKVSHRHQAWENIMVDMRHFFEQKVALAQQAGLSPNRLVLDPGLDFAKRTEDSVEVMKHLTQLAAFGCPLLIPISRKTFLGESLGIDDPAQRDAATIACLPFLLELPAAIVRVHHVAAIWEGLKVLCAIESNR